MASESGSWWEILVSLKQGGSRAGPQRLHTLPGMGLGGSQLWKVRGTTRKSNYKVVPWFSPEGGLRN